MNQSSTAKQPDTVLFVEGFGRQTAVHDADHPINDEDEDLHSVFYARSVLMSWHTTLMGNNRQAWDMHEAEHTASMNARTARCPGSVSPKWGSDHNPTRSCYGYRRSFSACTTHWLVSAGSIYRRYK